MKKLLLVLVSIMMMSSAAMAQDRQPIQPNQIPQTAQKFIKKYWLEANVFRASKSKKDVVVTLNNATTIVFDVRGQWTRIKSFEQIPTDMLPYDIVAYVGQYYPDAMMLQADKSANGYRIRLDNELVLQFNTKGKFIKLI